MVPFLNPQAIMSRKFLPISGLVGSNLKTKVDKSTCPWWNGPCLFEVLDTVEVLARDPNGPFRLPIIDKFKDLGTVVMGKVESGSIREGDSLTVMPNRVNVKVVALYVDEIKLDVQTLVKTCGLDCLELKRKIYCQALSF
ncbi:Eukaryotic peptide chain release factor GTP-binding subunit, partial [Bienertia sinuspersici]